MIFGYGSVPKFISSYVKIKAFLRIPSLSEVDACSSKTRARRLALKITIEVLQPAIELRLYKALGEIGLVVQDSGHTVLLVEDDSNDVLFIRRAFLRVNPTIEIHIVKDGDAAVEYLKGTGDFSDRDRYPLPALILLDLKLPRRSGIEVLEWIRQRDGIKRIPVVVLTSSRERIDVDLSYDLGVNSYLVKPVSFDALSDMVGILNAYWLGVNEYPAVALAR